MPFTSFIILIPFKDQYLKAIGYTEFKPLNGPLLKMRRESLFVVVPSGNINNGFLFGSD